MSKTSVKSLKEAIVKQLDENKAENIVVVDVINKTDIASYMIIASGLAQRHLEALSDKVSAYLKEKGHIHNIEGKNSGWVLIDAYGIIVHLFDQATRDNYSLEKLWQVQKS